MTTLPLKTQIDRLTLAYHKLTGFPPARGVTSYRDYAWIEWINAGYTEQDLEIVIARIKKGIREGWRYRGSLRFSTLIGRPELFQEELDVALAEKRNEPKPKTPKERVIAQARPVISEAPVNHSAVPVSVLIQNLRKAAGMNL